MGDDMLKRDDNLKLRKKGDKSELIAQSIKIKMKWQIL